VPRRNRVDPWGDLHACSDRGLLTGNRGCLVDDDGAVVRHHRSSLWIACLLEYRDWRWPLARPGRWTPIFFLDDAVALAAGHRPCGLCRRHAYHAYRDAVTRGVGASEPLKASDLDRRLVAERHRRGRGIERAADRIVWTAPWPDLPDGTVVVDDDQQARLVVEERLFTFSFAGWRDATSRPASGVARILTPPTSVHALANGYVPMLHATAV
jgi:hypothetical protein